MGTDIHCYTEVLRDGRWVAITEGLISDIYDGSDWSKKRSYDNCDEIIRGRHYDLFAFMAGARNGYGFAGVETGNAIEPISMPKGTPANVSDYVEDKLDWCHTKSHLSLSEIKSYDITGKVKIKRGCITDRESFEYFLKHGRPDSWCGAASGLPVSNDAYLEAIHMYKDDNSVRVITYVEWEIPYSEMLSTLYDHAVPQLEKLSKDGKGEDVRLVFGFDS